MKPAELRKWTAEVLGTFCLVFAGTGAIIVNDFSQGAITHAGVSATFGLIVFAMIYTFGPISGSHLNPAVTLGLWVSKQVEGREVVPYIVAQCLGAIAASLILRSMFPGHATFGATLPSGGIWRAFVFELFLSWMLMLVILKSSDRNNPQRAYAGFVIGAVVGLEALFGGPISGASMNPARSLGPAIASGAISDLWIYWTAPCVGMVLAVFTNRLVMLTPPEEHIFRS